MARRRRDTPPRLGSSKELSHLVFGLLTSDDRPAQNVTEWAKQERCWRQMRALSWSRPSGLATLMVPLASETADSECEDEEATEVMTGALPEDDPLVREMSAVSGDAWLALSNWAKQTDNLSGGERRFAYSIGSS